jgi:hypothetical protein
MEKIDFENRLSKTRNSIILIDFENRLSKTRNSIILIDFGIDSKIDLEHYDFP